MWIKENEQLTLAKKIIVAWFEVLGWFYNSKGRKGNGFDGYGDGLVLMLLMELVVWKPIMCTISFIQWSFDHPKPAKILDIKNIRVFKKKWSVPF